MYIDTYIYIYTDACKPVSHICLAQSCIYTYFYFAHICCMGI